MVVPPPFLEVIVKQMISGETFTASRGKELSSSTRVEVPYFGVVSWVCEQMLSILRPLTSVGLVLDNIP